jgi:hypothetical protein
VQSGSLSQGSPEHGTVGVGLVMERGGWRSLVSIGRSLGSGREEEGGSDVGRAEALKGTFYRGQGGGRCPVSHRVMAFKAIRLL